MAAGTRRQTSATGRRTSWRKAIEPSDPATAIPPITRAITRIPSPAAQRAAMAPTSRATAPTRAHPLHRRLVKTTQMAEVHRLTAATAANRYQM